jgi:hypothetical protein
MGSLQTPFGKPMLKHWLFDPTYKNLNHGMHRHPELTVADKAATLTLNYQVLLAHIQQLSAMPSAPF